MAITPLGAAIRGLAAAAIGTAVMDAQQYVQYRVGGGTMPPLEWEFGAVHTWQDASAPGQVGKRIAEAWVQHPLPDRYAGLTNNLMHWGFGIQWGLAYGLVAGSLQRRPLWLGPPFGTAVWLFGYAVLPLGGFYKPIWEYDANTLSKDLATHLTYGIGTAAAFKLLAADTAP